MHNNNNIITAFMLATRTGMTIFTRHQMAHLSDTYSNCYLLSCRYHGSSVCLSSAGVLYMYNWYEASWFANFNSNYRSTLVSCCMHVGSVTDSPGIDAEIAPVCSGDEVEYNCTVPGRALEWVIT